MGLVLDLEQVENIKDCGQRRGWKLKSSAKSDIVDTWIRVAAGTRWKSLFMKPFHCEGGWTGTSGELRIQCNAKVAESSCGGILRDVTSGVCVRRRAHWPLEVSIEESHSRWGHDSLSWGSQWWRGWSGSCTWKWQYRTLIEILVNDIRCFLPKLLSDERVAYKLRFSLNHAV